MNYNKNLLQIILVIAIVMIAIYFFGFTNREKTISNNNQNLPVVSTVSESGSKPEQEQEITIDCSTLSKYVSDLTHVCADGGTITTAQYPGNSNFEGKSREAIKLASQLDSADKELNSEYAKTLNYFGTASYTAFPYVDGSYDARLRKDKQVLIDAENAWIIARNNECELRNVSIPPYAIGSNSLDYFDRIDCHIEYTQARVEFLKKLNNNFSKLDEPSKGP